MSTKVFNTAAVNDKDDVTVNVTQKKPASQSRQAQHVSSKMELKNVKCFNCP